MITFAVVGTSQITRLFVDAARGEGWRLTAVVGSSEARAAEFVASLGALDPKADSAGTGTPAVFGDAERAAATWGGVDVVYVASPNSMHLTSAAPFLRAGRHVIVEKPAFSNPAELAAALALADASGVLLLEAARHIWEPNFGRVRDEIAALGGITGASLVFRQFSSKVASYRAGERPRVFTAEFSGGALADLGVYQVYAAIAWFGMPTAATYCAEILPDTGADASGVGLLRYGTFTVEIAVSKVHASRQRSEIYGADGTTISVDAVAGISSIAVASPGRIPVELAVDAVEANPLSAEVRGFTRLIEAFPQQPAEGPSPGQLRQLAEQVATVSEWMRRDAGIIFAAARR